ncbi:MAG: guanylate kinase [Prevotellaceae bacterium]|nr:guanylate kinase [Prevotellaceae bacterium]
MSTVTVAGRCVIFSAPSGSGKTTIIHYLMRRHPEFRLSFSVSATSRLPRGSERNGVDYFFLSPEEFRQKIALGELLEWEEVYPGRFYGTLRSPVERQLSLGGNVVFDVDVKGGLNIKRHFADRALSVFIQPPSVDELRRRLTARATDDERQILQRLAKAEYEMSFAPQFDKIIVNDNLSEAVESATGLLSRFLLGV